MDEIGVNVLSDIIMRQMNVIDIDEAIRRMYSGEWIVIERVCSWHEHDDIIRFTLPPTDGTTGKQWIERFGDKGIEIEQDVRSMLLSNDFKPTKAVTVEIAVIRGVLIDDNFDRTTKNIMNHAENRGFTKPNAEDACLIREVFTDTRIREMGLQKIVVMHEPIKDSTGDPSIFGVSRCYNRPWLRRHCGGNACWHCDDGFAFVSKSFKSCSLAL